MATVSSYRNYEEEARGLVQQVLSTSVERSRQELAGREQPSAEWPVGKDFTVEKGQNAVAKLVEVHIMPVHSVCMVCTRYRKEF